MREDIENKTVSMAVSGSKFTGRMPLFTRTRIIARSNCENTQAI